jgi:hypothetical protein
MHSFFRSSGAPVPHADRARSGTRSVFPDVIAVLGRVFSLETTERRAAIDLVHAAHVRFDSRRYLERDSAYARVTARHRSALRDPRSFSMVHATREAGVLDRIIPVEKSRTSILTAWMLHKFWVAPVTARRGITRLAAHDRAFSAIHRERHDDSTAPPRAGHIRTACIAPRAVLVW